jgi:conjugal transfer pilus assembly protein TraB
MRGAVKDCFVVVAAYGDQSAERAYIRTTKLSCVGTDGRAFDARLSATVADGEDGGIGMRGHMVRRQGAFLQQAILASLASGISQVFRASTSTQSISALGATSTVQSGEEFKAGFAGGVSNAADRLANYFISEAEQLHAVVEVGAGRRVTILLTGGLRMSSAANTTTSATTSDLEDE